MNNTRSAKVNSLGVVNPFIDVGAIANSFLMATQSSELPIFDKTYNFETVIKEPESGRLSQLGMSLLTLGFIRRRATKITN